MILGVVANGWDPLAADKDVRIKGDFGSPHNFIHEDLCAGRVICAPLGIHDARCRRRKAIAAP